jgi:hypothetical protein
MRRTYRAAVENGFEINIHFHVFEPSNLRALVELAARKLRLRWRIVDQQAHFPSDCPNGILLVVRVTKHGGAWWRSQWNGLRARRDRRTVVSPDARPLSDANEMRRTR